MATGTMHMAMNNFFVGRGADFADLQVEPQCHAGQRMITVEHNFVVGDIGYGKDHGVIVFAAIVAGQVA